MQSDFGFVTAALLVGVSLSAALVALTISSPAQAQSVTLRSSDGSLTISGPLLRFDGNTYAIKTGARGELNFAVSDFLCISESCPNPNAFGIHGSNTIGAELMPRLIEAYARLRGEYVRISNGHHRKWPRSKWWEAMARTAPLSTCRLTALVPRPRALPAERLLSEWRRGP
jgi:hypothetical protein